jgi:hypothetical protein
MIPKSLSSDLIRGWAPVFGKDHAPKKNLALTMAGGVLRKINANTTKAARNRSKNASPAAWFTNRC